MLKHEDVSIQAYNSLASLVNHTLLCFRLIPVNEKGQSLKIKYKNIYPYQMFQQFIDKFNQQKGLASTKERLQIMSIEFDCLLDMINDHKQNCFSVDFLDFTFNSKLVIYFKFQQHHFKSVQDEKRFVQKLQFCKSKLQKLVISDGPDIEKQKIGQRDSLQCSYLKEMLEHLGKGERKDECNLLSQLQQSLKELGLKQIQQMNQFQFQ